MMLQFLTSMGGAEALLAVRFSALWMPRSGSLHATAIDTLMRTSVFTLTTLCVLAQIILLIGLLLPRQKGPRFSPAWRWISTAAFAAFLVWMTVAAENLWSTIRLTHAAPGADQTEVTGVQFQWYFRYPGADGIYGKTRPELIDAAGGNPLGLDPADPHSHDDVVSSVLVLPVDRQIHLRLRSQDVIHGFFIPAVRIMQNATPGMPSQIHLTPTRVGDYAIVCTQLCGLGHYRMHAVLRVVPAHDFNAWMAQREASLKER